MKFRHILLAIFAILAIAFMQPLVFFVGGITLLIGVGGLIFRDLSPASQEAVEKRLLGWLQRARHNNALVDYQKARQSLTSTLEAEPLPEPPRRRRAKASAHRIAASDANPPTL